MVFHSSVEQAVAAEAVSAALRPAGDLRAASLQPELSCEGQRQLAEGAPMAAGPTERRMLHLHLHHLILPLLLVVAGQEGAAGQPGARQS